jgi:hypothetical protein
MQLFIRHKRSAHHTDRKGFSCTISQENYPNKYSNILKVQRLGRNPREKHTRCHDKSIKMQRCVYGIEREASLKPIEILTG